MKKGKAERKSSRISKIKKQSKQLKITESVKQQVRHREK